MVRENVEILRKEKIRLIGDILDLYFSTTPIDKGVKYWYSDAFDNLYEKDILELSLILKLYSITRASRI